MLFRSSISSLAILGAVYSVVDATPYHLKAPLSGNRQPVSPTFDLQGNNATKNIALLGTAENGTSAGEEYKRCYMIPKGYLQPPYWIGSSGAWHSPGLLDEYRSYWCIPTPLAILTKEISATADQGRVANGPYKAYTVYNTVIEKGVIKYLHLSQRMEGGGGVGYKFYSDKPGPADPYIEWKPIDQFNGTITGARIYKGSNWLVAPYGGEIREVTIVNGQFQFWYSRANVYTCDWVGKQGEWNYGMCDPTGYQPLVSRSLVERKVAKKTILPVLEASQNVNLPSAPDQTTPPKEGNSNMSLTNPIPSKNNIVIGSSAPPPEYSDNIKEKLHCFIKPYCFECLINPYCALVVQNSGHNPDPRPSFKDRFLCLIKPHCKLSLPGGEGEWRNHPQDGPPGQGQHLA